MQEKVISVFKSRWSDSFWKNNTIFFAGSLTIAALNYLFYPILGRIMDVSHFGEVQALFGIITIFGMALAGFKIVAVNITVNDHKNGQQVIHQFERFLLIAVAILGLLISIASPFIRDFFGFESTLPFFALAANLLISVPLSFRMSFLQGRSDFSSLSISGIIAAISKLLFAVLLVVWGGKTFGAIVGLGLAQAVALAYTMHAAKKSGFSGSIFARSSLKELRLIRPHVTYLSYVSVALLLVTVMYGTDVMVAKRYFDPETAGLYAGISTVAKIIFFATASFSAVLLASVGQSFSEKHNYMILRKSLILVLAGGGLILLCFTLAPHLVTTILLGQRYETYAHLLPMLGAVLYLVAIANLFVNYYLALRRYTITYIVLTGGLLTFVLTFFNHDSVRSIIENYLAGAVLMILLIVGWAKFRNHKSDTSAP